MSTGAKRDAVLRPLRGESLEIVARDLGVTAADLSGWRDAFPEAGSASLKSRARDDRDATVSQCHAVAIVARTVAHRARTDGATTGDRNDGNSE